MGPVDQSSATNGGRLGRVLSVVGTVWVGVSVLSAMGLFTALGLGGVLPAGLVSSIWPAFILIAVGRGISRQSRAAKPDSTSRTPQPGTTLTPPILRDPQTAAPPPYSPAPPPYSPPPPPYSPPPPPYSPAPSLPKSAALPPRPAAPPRPTNIEPSSPSTREPARDDFPETLEPMPSTSLSPDPLDMPDSLPRAKTSKELIEEAKRNLSRED
jgi:hypothetical protein